MLQTRALVVTVCLSGLLACSGSSPRGGGSGGDSDTGGAGDTGGSPGTGGRAATGGSPGTGGSTSTGGKGDTGGASGGDTGGAGDTGGKGGGSGGAGTGGAKPDGGAADGPPSSSGAGCQGVTAKFCADFDDQMNGMEPKGPFTIQKGGYATITVDSSKAFSGKQSLHFHMANSPNDALMHLNFAGAPVFPFANNDIHGRVMLFLTRNPSRHWDLTTAFAAATVDDESTGEQFSLSGSSPDNHVMSVHQPGDKSVDSKDLWPLNKWVCVQWEFAATGTTSSIQIKFDGKFIDKGMNASMASWKPPGFKSMFFGWKNFEGGITGNLDFWADDLAFGEQEIPCPPAP